MTQVIFLIVFQHNSNHTLSIYFFFNIHTDRYDISDEIPFHEAADLIRASITTVSRPGRRRYMEAADDMIRKRKTKKNEKQCIN